MAAGSGQTLSKAWLVLAVILILFFVAVFLDKAIQTAVPTYTGIFNWP